MAQSMVLKLLQLTKKFICMKIIILAPMLWNSIGGHPIELAKVLSDKHQIDYLEPIVHSSNLPISFKITSNNTVPKNVNIIKRSTNLGANFFYLIYTEYKNLLYFIKEDYDVYITYHTTFNILGVIFAKLTGKKVVLIYVDDLSDLFKVLLIKIFTKYLFTPLVASLSGLIIVTSYKLKKSIDLFNRNIEYIPNGVNLHSFKVEDTFKEKSEFIVGFVGGFGNWINFDMVLKSAQFLMDNGVKFVLIGDGEMFNYVKDKISELKLDNIELLGVKSHTDLPKLICEMDICIIPFKVNHLTDRVSPVKLFEYWSLKKPVISTSFYEIKKIAKDKVIFVNNSKELSYSILKFKNNKNLCKKYGDIGYDEVRKNYDWNILAGKYELLIKKLFI